MIALLVTAFGQGAEKCVTLADADPIEIFDCYDCEPASQRSFVKSTEAQPVHFTLANPDRATLVFTALDNCLFTSADVARCDFMIGNEEKMFFVEIKNSNASKRRQRRRQAIDQLDSTLTIMRNAIDLSNTELFAVVSLGTKIVHPVQTAERANKLILFKDKHNAARKPPANYHSIF
jgi:hypothetical protein